MNILLCILNTPDFKCMAELQTGELVHLQTKSTAYTANLTKK